MACGAPCSAASRCPPPAPSPMPAAETIAVTVIGGYLGSGKTTLLNHVLRTADGRVAVLVNDFGDVNIDADLVARHDGGTLELANGCICCSLVDGFAAALDSISGLSPRPERLLIEASGVADPASVAAYAHTPGFALDAVVVLADAESIRANANDKYVGEAVRGQLAAADLLVVNKIDLVEAGAIESVERWLADLAPGAAIVRAAHGVVAFEVLVGSGPMGDLAAADSTEVGSAADRPHVDVETWSLTWRGAVTRGAVEAAMAHVPDGLIRLKGVIAITGDPVPHVLQRVGRRWSLRPMPPDVGLREPDASQVVAIGRPGAIDGDWLAANFAPNG